MKRIILVLVAAMFCLTAMAQEQASRTMRVFYGGQVVYMRDVAQMDSINFLLNGGDEENDPNTGGSKDSSSIWVGVVAFNMDVNQLPITNNLEAAKTFIDLRDNNEDFTAFAYAVSRGNLMFDAEGLPEFDKIFMLNFSDGTDNYSNSKWGQEGRRVGANFVYDTAHYDISQRVGLNSYALGFGAQEADFREKMQKVVVGGGQYHSAVSSADLQPTFNQIANSIIASAQNVTLQTMPGIYDEEIGYKHFRFTFTATYESRILRDTILARMEGENATGYTLTITKPGTYARFDAPVSGNLDAQTNKVIMPLNNLKFVVEEEDIQFDFELAVSFDGEKYYADVEDASTAESVSKRLAVVLVLDCSTSMGEAFKPMKDAAIDFIETLERMAGQGGNSHRGDYVEDLGGGVSMKMKPVQGGTFQMGATSEQGSDAESDEKPVHSVTLDGFHIGETEVTQAQWKAVMGTNPSNWKGDDLPVEQVSWNEAVQFCEKLSQMTGKTYRLPTEAEWEYAARGGQQADGTKYAGSSTIGDVAWYTSNSGSKTHPVGQKQPNALGLYDMSGNVYEWCSDWYSSNYYSSSPSVNPQGPSSGSGRVCRGGSWSYGDAQGCRVSNRAYSAPDGRDGNLGFRVVCER